MNDLSNLSDDELKALYGQGGLSQWSDDELKAAYRPQQSLTAPEAPVTAGGLYSALDRGAADAAASIAGLPKAISDAGAQGIQGASNWLVDKLGLPESMRDTRDLSKPGLIKLPTSEEASAAIQRDLYGGATPYEPQNRAERYGRSMGEFLVNAATPGGVVSRALSVALPAAATEAVKEQGGGPIAQTVAGLVGGAGAAKLGNVAEHLGTTALPSIERGAPGNLRDVAGAQYKAVEKDAMAIPTSALDRSIISKSVENHLHDLNFRRANAPETYAVLDEIRAGNPRQGGDLADLINARQKLGNISGKDGVAAGQARDIIDKVLDIKIPGASAALETADRNWNALKTAETLNAKFQKAADQTGATASGLNLGNKLRQGAVELANNPNRTRYMSAEQVAALRDLGNGTITQNAARYFSNLLGGGGGLGALAAGGLGLGAAGSAAYTGDSRLAAGAAPILAGLALRRGYNRSVANQARGISGSILAGSPQAQALGSTYIPPLTLGGSLGSPTATSAALLAALRSSSNHVRD